MSTINATYLSANAVVLYCENCTAQVDTIPSSEILPLLRWLSENGESVYCSDCDPLPDKIPGCLYPAVGEAIVVNGEIFIINDDHLMSVYRLEAK